ncbi:MAG: type II toxin-antitoxin system mRNA interferase toxin, RelE/StbE family [Candidatus Pacebacteria bacterium]|nr:type II toxin-antitoxin system mRNA interferase toxin, RelE/StbE family [Candidatus Paceibacterota bacterium]
MNVHYSSQFKKQYRKLPKNTQEQFKKRFVLFVEDQTHAQLHVHKLVGEYKSLWSMNISGDIRAVFDVSFKDDILFVAIGSHSTLYS